MMMTSNTNHFQSNPIPSHYSAQYYPHSQQYPVRSQPERIPEKKIFRPKGKEVVSNQVSGSQPQYSPPSSFPHSPPMSHHESPRELLMFVSDRENYSIVYPNWWTMMEPGFGQILFISPRKESHEFCENISVVVEDLSQTSFTLPDYTSNILRDIATGGNKILHSAMCLLAGQRAHEIIYSDMHTDNTQLYFRQVWIISEVTRKAYIVTFTCPAGKFQSSIPFVEQLMSSFRILPTQTHH